nr:uncharacterized protein LOC109149075 [Ipomoea trifida]
MRDDYRAIWKDACANIGGDILKAIGVVTMRSKAWNNSAFGEIFKHKRRVQAHIRVIVVRLLRSMGLRLLESQSRRLTMPSSIEKVRIAISG